MSNSGFQPAGPGSQTLGNNNLYLKYIALAACLVVLLVLLRGLWSMMRGGDANLSQKLMRMRVAAQAIAVVLIVAAIYFAK